MNRIAVLAVVTTATALTAGAGDGGGGTTELRADTQGWEVRIPDRLEIAAATTAPLTIAIAVDRGLTVSKDAAVIIDLAPEPGITLKKQRLGRGDAVDPEADAPRFALPVRGDLAGDHAIKIHVRFWLCGTRSCRPIEVRKTATIGVPASPPTDPSR